MFGLSKEEIGVLKQLNTPAKIQSFLNSMEINFEKERETCLSPTMVLKQRKCHCIEGAILAALILRMHGHKPLVMDLTSSKKDFDHVVALFGRNGKWGAISKTNHAVLRYREPVYKTIRELALSYFHEYFCDAGKKNLRSYSSPVNLAKFDKKGWMTSEEDIWYIAEHLADVKHHPILTRSDIAGLRKADEIEIEAGKLVEWKK